VTDKKKNISIIYYQKNDSPKYVEINKKRFILFLVGLPTITLIAVTLGAIGLIQTSPFHLLDIYRQNSKARIAVATNANLQNTIEKLSKENQSLLLKVQSFEQAPSPIIPTAETATSLPSKEMNKCPEPVICKQGQNSPTATSIGLSTLSFFKPNYGQKDKTNPASLNLTGFKVNSNKDSVNLQFNIINLLGGEVKLAGHIIVLMKSEQGIQVYPSQALALNDYQINYSVGEPFATQRFRPVDAVFSHPKKGGNFLFTVFVFSKTGDLIHYQNIPMTVH
jgi:hypothetical protein